ncbi:hypothetical protein B9T11_10105 [Wohlfahrtiimonas chitiniclastica]|uniref:hypothetical protein n=1 Tax=Wohlfahrtiimonas chitiniclastica TaxID=400946 RepID=UPI000B99A722|nr:hypothetical protein [Wohlfahrtiimonas chitiniclastica]OYQ77502.1 hypothetical protein B9T11_10105 [Wohlfahrtiimonas chitiniclastica]
MNVVDHLTEELLVNFPDSNYSGMAFNYSDKNINSLDENKLLAMSLPNNYCIQIINEGGFSIINKIYLSLREHVQNESVLNKFIYELTLAINCLAKIISVDFNLASLRIVNKEYVEKEYPSVSNMYHRDSSSLTLTKTFYGEGALYIENSNVNRDFFIHNSIAPHESLAMIESGKFKILDDGMWLLLKGEMSKSIDSRNKEFVQQIRGVDTNFDDMFLGTGLIHRGGRFINTSTRLVFTFSSYTTKRHSQ